MLRRGLHFISPIPTLGDDIFTATIRKNDLNLPGGHTTYDLPRTCHGALNPER